MKKNKLLDLMIKDLLRIKKRIDILRKNKIIDYNTGSLKYNRNIRHGYSMFRNALFGLRNKCVHCGTINCKHHKIWWY